LKEDSAIINRMGRRCIGGSGAIEKYRRFNWETLKNKLTSNEDATLDYEICFDALFDYVDYFAVNVSSPNTPNLRALQDKEPLTQLLQTKIRI
jgi:dihydroorotate dehydrogenase